MKPMKMQLIPHDPWDVFPHAVFPLIGTLSYKRHVQEH